MYRNNGRIGELNIQRGTNRFGSYIRIRMGNFEDLWRQTDSGYWYKDSRDVRPMPRCQVRDGEALQTLNAFDPNVEEAERA